MRFLRTLSAPRAFLAAASALVAVVLAVSAAVAFWPGHPDKHLTAYFPETTGLYAGDQVQVLGVQVGRVDSITPQGGRIKVVMSYDPAVRIPAAAKAAIITPTLVSTRAVQLTPGYRSGPVLADGATLPEPRTAVPVEWGQIEQELDTLATTLGPHGGSSGALNAALSTAAGNLNGQGQNMHDTLTALTQAITTLSDDRGDLFATLNNLNKFVAVLRQANGQVGQFGQELAAVSGVLADNRKELAATLATLNSSVGTVTGFVKGNRAILARDTGLLNDVAANLSGADTALADFLQVAPTEAANLNDMYDPVNHALNANLALANFQNPAEFVCSTIFSAGGTPAQCQQALSPLLQVLKQSSPPVSVDPVNRDGYGSQSSPASGGPGSGSGGGLHSLLLGGNGS
ncbi:MAG: MCE family protein [Streptosporangiales bacterium]|nr:MCE family protein [Streptosporangiales bacterium]